MNGIDEAMIERLVRAFYERVRADEVLGPIFAARIDDWEPHLQRMFAFWSSVTLMSGRYLGRPMMKHLPLPVDSEHFDRWLALFGQTARAMCPPAAAAHFIKCSPDCEQPRARHCCIQGRGSRGAIWRREHGIQAMSGEHDSGDDAGSPPCFLHELEPDGSLRVDPQQVLDVARWRKAERERLIGARLKLDPEYRAAQQKPLPATWIESFRSLRGRLSACTGRYGRSRICGHGCR